LWYGGLPSNHSALVSSTAALIALKRGVEHPAFGVAITLAFIVTLDASSLRRQVGKHATAINKLAVGCFGHPPPLTAWGILVGNCRWYRHWHRRGLRSKSNFDLMEYSDHQGRAHDSSHVVAISYRQTWRQRVKT